MKDLLERVQACVATINAAPGKVWECDGEDIVGDPQIVYGKHCSYSICAIDLENQDGYDPETCETPEDSERIAAAIIEGHNIAPALLTEAITEITALRARVEELERECAGEMEFGGVVWSNREDSDIYWVGRIEGIGGPVEVRLDATVPCWDVLGRDSKGYGEKITHYPTLREAMQAAIDAAKGAEGA
jgi:hypothetical protein